jgi:hypothetical protein
MEAPFPLPLEPGPIAPPNGPRPIRRRGTGGRV